MPVTVSCPPHLMAMVVLSTSRCPTWSLGRASIFSNPALTLTLLKEEKSKMKVTQSATPSDTSRLPDLACAGLPGPGLVHGRSTGFASWLARISLQVWAVSGARDFSVLWALESCFI